VLKRYQVVGIVGIVGCLAVTGCGSVVTAERPQGPAPDTKAIVLRYLRGDAGGANEPIIPDLGVGQLFNEPQSLGAVELSPPSLVQHNVLGWTWLTCLRAHPIATPARDYALFIRNNRIEDARLSVATDRCASQTYEELGRFFKKRKASGDNSSSPR
jgi:hypothetical protein